MDIKAHHNNLETRERPFISLFAADTNADDVSAYVAGTVERALHNDLFVLLEKSKSAADFVELNHFLDKNEKSALSFEVEELLPADYAAVLV